MKKFLYEKLQKLVYGAVAPHFAAMAEHDRQIEELNKLLTLRQDVLELREQLTAELARQTDKLDRQAEEEIKKLLALQQDVMELREQLISGLAEQTDKIDKKVEEWTWERYLRMEKKIEEWTWERYLRTEKAIEEWTWERFQRLDKEIEWWTWERYLRIRNWDENSLSYVPRHRLEGLFVQVTEHCNLNCQCCSHFSPLAKEEYIDIAEMEKDFSRLRKLSNGRIGTIHLSGGEPLLHPQICDVFEMTRKYFEETAIWVTTNGILLPTMPDAFWELCHKNKISMDISPYPINLNMELIERKAKEYEVSWRYVDGSDVKTTYFLPLDPTGRQNGRKSFLNCFYANECIGLKKGRIYTCCVALNIGHFNAAFGEALPDGSENSIDIYKAESMEEILEFLSKPIPLCDYCDVDGRRFGLPWGISKKEKSEWAIMEKK